MEDPAMETLIAISIVAIAGIWRGVAHHQKA
jgi:hypothetical protein